MSLFIFLTVTQAIVAALLVGVILMQKSEGGGLGTGGSPAGLMSARGAADFMTRLTTILATLFVALSIILAALATRSSGNRTIDDSLDRSVPTQQLPAAPVNPLDNAGTVPPAAAPGNAPAGGLAPTAPATR